MGSAVVDNPKWRNLPRLKRRGKLPRQPQLRVSSVEWNAFAAVLGWARALRIMGRQETELVCLVAMSGDRNVVVKDFGTPEGLGISAELEQTRAAGGRWVLVHNHPTGASLSGPDLGVLFAFPHLDAMVAVHRGYIHYAAKRRKHSPEAVVEREARSRSPVVALPARDRDLEQKKRDTAFLAAFAQAVYDQRKSVHHPLFNEYAVAAELEPEAVRIIHREHTHLACLEASDLLEFDYTRFVTPEEIADKRAPWPAPFDRIPEILDEVQRRRESAPLLERPPQQQRSGGGIFDLEGDDDEDDDTDTLEEDDEALESRREALVRRILSETYHLLDELDVDDRNDVVAEAEQYGVDEGMPAPGSIQYALARHYESLGEIDENDLQRVLDQVWEGV